MKYIKFFVFSLFFFVLVSMVNVHAAVNDGVTDYSHLEPDENGRYWIYFEFESDEFTMYYQSDVHSAHVECWFDVTDYYVEHGCPDVYVDSSMVNIVFRSVSGTFPAGEYIVKGEFDGQPVDYSGAISGSNILLAHSLFPGCDFSGTYIDSSFIDGFKYLPVFSRYSSTVADDVRSFEYVQDKPKKSVPVPQVPVFEYEYINGKITGLVCCFRYPIDTVEHFYELVKSGKHSGSSHSSAADGSAYYQKTPYIYAASDTENEFADISTYLDYRVTFMIGSNSYTTNWSRLGIFGYSDAKNKFEITNRWNFDVYNQFQVLLLDKKNNADIWQCILRLDKLPDIITDFGIVSFSANDSIILTKVEVSAYNVRKRGARSSASEIVYSQFDCITNTHSSSVLPQSNPEVSAGDDGNITVNVNIDIDTVVPTVPSTSVPTGNTDVVPGISGDGSSSGGGSGFFDGISGLFDLVLKFLEVVITGLVRLGRLFFSLIGDIIDMCGEFPKLFGFIVDAFPPEFMTLMMIGFAAALVLKIFGR